MSRRKIVAIDFDATVTSGWGWDGEKTTFPPPAKGVQMALNVLRKSNCLVIIYTARTDLEEVELYLREHKIPYDNINNHHLVPMNLSRWKEKGCKLVADVYVDDKGITFNGEWNGELVEKILNFTSWAKGDNIDNDENENLRLNADIVSNLSPVDILNHCINLFKMKNGKGGYGNNYIRWGEIMTKLFPNGIELKTEDDWNRLGVFTMVMEKVIRTSNLLFSNDESLFDSKRDTGFDLTTYSAMLTSLLK